MVSTLPGEAKADELLESSELGVEDLGVVGGFAHARRVAEGPNEVDRGPNTRHDEGPCPLERSSSMPSFAGA